MIWAKDCCASSTAWCLLRIMDNLDIYESAKLLNIGFKALTYKLSIICNILNCYSLRGHIPHVEVDKLCRAAGSK